LYESIASSNIVIDKYYDSKYVDDAIYYIARSYFSLGEFYKSNKYFDDLITNHKTSIYYDESKLWLEYTNLKLGLLDSVLINVLSIEEKFKQKEKKIDESLFFLLYNLKGDLFLELKEYNDSFLEFEKSLDFLDSKQKKTMMYSKLAYISESENELNRAIEYLEKIQIITNQKETKIESFKKWLDIMKKLKRYDDIIIEIQDKINTSDFQDATLQDELNIELAIVYLKKNDFSKSKNLLNDIINSTNQKKIKCQSYYWLGNISLVHEFDLELAAEYFNLVNETMRSSNYSKEVKAYLNNIEAYNSLLQEYDFLINEKLENTSDNIIDDDNFIPIPGNIINEGDYKDSLLFVIAEKLYFDFKQEALAIEKYQKLIDNYPDSDYFVRSKKIIDQLNGIENSANKQTIQDTIQLLRDSAWENLEQDKDKSIKSFHNIINQHDDFYSYYSLGLIYENYAYNPDSSILYYLKSLNKCDDDLIKKNLTNKLLLTKEFLNNKVDSLNQRINYFIAIDFMIKDFNLDSAILYFQASSSFNTDFEKKSKELSEIIMNYRSISRDLDILSLNDSLLIPDWEHSKYDNHLLDSLLFEMVNISSYIFKQDTLAENFIKIITRDTNSFYYKISEYMHNKIQNNSLILIDSLESYSEPYNSISFANIDKYHKYDSLISVYKDDLIFNELLLNYFPENINDNDYIDTMKKVNIQDGQKEFNIQNNLMPDLNIKMDLNE